MKDLIGKAKMNKSSLQQKIIVKKTEKILAKQILESENHLVSLLTVSS